MELQLIGPIWALKKIELEETRLCVIADPENSKAFWGKGTYKAE